MNKRFPFQHGPATFLGTPYEPLLPPVLVPAGPPPHAPLAFLGLPYDASTTYRAGARFGPRAIRTASHMLIDGAHPRFETDPSQVIVDRGDAAIPYVGQADALTAIERAVTKIMAAKQHPLLAGGDHSVTLGALRAVRQFHDAPLACIHFDAHCDTWADHFGDKTGHGTWTRNAIEEGLIDPERTVQIGIRSPVDRVTKRWLRERGGRVFSAMEALGFRPHEMAGTIERIVRPWDDGQKPGRPVYLTFDIDALDPAHAPGTGTPEIGGLTTLWVLEVMERLRGLNFAAMDVVEVLPAHDVSEITALAAATLLWTYAAMHPAALPTIENDA